MSDKEPLMFQMGDGKMTRLPANGTACGDAIKSASAGYSELKEATLLAFVPGEIRDDKDARFLHLKAGEFQIVWVKVEPFAHLNQEEDTYEYEIMRDLLRGWGQILGEFVLMGCKSPGTLALKYRFQLTRYGAGLLASIPDAVAR